MRQRKQEEAVWISWQTRQYQRAKDLQHALEEEGRTNSNIDGLLAELFLANQMLEAMKHTMQEARE
ncbi:hypothetical protein PVA45_08365 (plasmid) [Entomospira entomophila]|uniref:Uncharacterized protein n=1 Tax=Entomospira entomophila TaxID=2719988 RepID=A0A968GDE1_9SPIO|nr:hypothetical protein [Entomospira entomophilus]NIZ41528.1 hypothetical protein [Entomospira entomophilus]WDI36444.1 hypothetical protein PVA45_08365 [Entomospira entomophilus]